LATISRYRHYDPFSYTLGMSVTMELLLHMPEVMERIYLSPSIEENENVANLHRISAEHHIPVETNVKAFNILSPKGNCFVIGVFRKYEAPLADTSHVLLVNPSDAGNLGTIVRTAIGFGIENVAIVKPAVDIFDPKTIRASMGAVFHVNFEYFDDVHTYRQRFMSHNPYAFMLDAQVPLHMVGFKRPYSLVFGNEAAGLPVEYGGFCETVIIPHSNKIDSLNVTIAAGIAMYAATMPEWKER